MTGQRTPEGSPRSIFVLGGVRSGKSRFAGSQASSLADGSAITVIATADSSYDDPGMKDRIKRHRADRPAGWKTVEEPLELARALNGTAPGSVVIVDCLTVWLSNHFAQCGDADGPGFKSRVEATVLPALKELEAAITQARNHVILVSNDVGSGVAPPTLLGNVFADIQGTVNQRIAAACDEVYHMVAGIPSRIK